MKKVHKHTKNVSHLALYTLMYPSGICYQGVCNSLERTDSFAWESDFFTLFVIRVISAFTSGIRLVIMPVLNSLKYQQHKSPSLRNQTSLVELFVIHLKIWLVIPLVALIISDSLKRMNP